MAADKVGLWNIALSKIGARRLATITDDTEEATVLTAVYPDIRDEVLKEAPWGFAQKRATLADMTIPSVDDWEAAGSYAVDDEVGYNALYYTCLVAHTSGIFSDDLASLDWELTTDWVTATQYIVGGQAYHSGLSYSCLEAHKSGVFATDLAADKWILSELPAMTSDGMTKVFKLPADFLKLNLVSSRSAQVKLEGGRLLTGVSSLDIVYTYQNDTPSDYGAQFTIALTTRLAGEVAYNIIQMRAQAADLIQQYETIELPKAESTDSQQGTPIAQLADEWFNYRADGAGAGPTVQEGQSTWHPF